MGTSLNPFSAIPDAVSLTDLPDIMDLRLAIIGESGIGKSWLAASAPPPVLHYDFDNRAASLRKLCLERGLQDIKVKTMVDSQENPWVLTGLENDLTMLKSVKKSGNPIPRSYVLDSATYLRKSMEYTALKQDQTMGTKIRITPSRIMRTASAMTSANWVRQYFEYLINEFSTLGNIIVVFHQKDQVDKDKTKPNNTEYTGKLTIDPQYLESILSIFNERWHIIRESGTLRYRVKCSDDQDFNAITSLNIDKEENPNIQEILKKHQERIARK